MAVTAVELENPKYRMVVMAISQGLSRQLMHDLEARGPRTQKKVAPAPARIFNLA